MTDVRRIGMRAALAAAAVLAAELAAAPAGAQVGYPPAQSPFEDVEYRQAVTFYTGYFNAARDRAGVAPQGGPLFGARYDIVLAGPAAFTARLGVVQSTRTVLDPARDQGDRVIGDERRPLAIADVGVTLALTGQKSFYDFQPYVHAGAGLATNFASADPGGYRFGTRFALSGSLGTRYVPGGRWSVRGDVGTTLYQVRYPDRYFTPGLDSTSVLASDASKSSWSRNLIVTLGASYHFFR